MQISSSFTGTKLKTFKTRVNARETMNYAAAINDNNPCYFDDLRKEGLTAHPLHPVSITWKITGSIREFIDAQGFPKEVLLTQVHHTEFIEYHRPLVSGETLAVNGAIVAILPHRAGSQVVIRYDADDEKGAPVFTEYCGALLRGVACADSGGIAGELPEIPKPENPTKPVWVVPIDIDPLRPYIYDGCTDICFPIHTSPKFAQELGLPGIILQGTATLAFSIREIVDREADREPAQIKMVACRFTGMVFPGTCIAIHLLERRISSAGKELFFEARNHEARKAISDGYVRIEKRRG
jgi:acyl dehydratase